jgi:hypothetical protein
MDELTKAQAEAYKAMVQVQAWQKKFDAAQEEVVRLSPKAEPKTE